MAIRLWMNPLVVAVSCVLITVSTSCSKKKPLSQANQDTPATGQIRIVADESFAPLLRDEISTFTSIYKEASINAEFLPEIKATAAFFNDPELRLLVISRRLLESEKQHFEKSGLPPHEIKIAIDAVAFVLNTQNTDTNLQYSQVADIVSGKITDWKEINPDSRLDKITLVFDHQQSSTVRYLGEKLLGGKQITANAFAVDSNPAVISYVEKVPGAIGVIGVSWISNKDDSLSGNFLKRVRVAAISAENLPDTFYLPVRRFIYSMHYPFLRELFIVSQEKHSGLGTGFATYVASDEGQRIVQRSGLLPVDKAVRVIELKEQF